MYVVNVLHIVCLMYVVYVVDLLYDIFVALTHV
jgi:hypothetical protein